MNDFHQRLLNLSDSMPKCFHGMFQFGSSLRSERPEDIDLLVVYGNSQDITDVSQQRRKLLDMLVIAFEGVTVDLVALSDEELEVSGFLQKTEWIPIKDG